MVNEIDLTPEAVERLASHLELSTPQTFTKENAAATLRALSARLAEVEADRDECRRMMRLERQIADKNAARAEAAEALLAKVVSFLKEVSDPISGYLYGPIYNEARTVLAEIGGDA